jgi:murein tripeptide amidase MpaA
MSSVAVPAYRADHYYSYEEMTQWLRALVEALPELFRLRSIGVTPQGRELWLVAVGAGDIDARPAYWIDANLHASELTGSAAALYTLNYLATHRDSPAVAELLRERTLYIAPRINPDGAEYILTTGIYLRSVERLWPEPESPPDFIKQDVDGDGEVLQMRVLSPDGAWKVSKHDPRLMIPREPWDSQGTFYHLYAEGRFADEVWADGAPLPDYKSPHGLDLNRSFPSKWEHESQQLGAGPYPLSEPETRAIVEFFSQHATICGAMTFHTFSGVLLRPFSDRPDAEMPQLDQTTYKKLGARCEQLTGYRCVSTYHDFCYDPSHKRFIRGVFDDWAYEHHGVHAFTMELWCPWRHAGLDFSDDLMRFFMRRTEEDDLAMLSWNDTALNGRAFVTWRVFEHDQLGAVEIGGWRWLMSWRNAPPELLEQECRGVCLFVLDHARALPSPRLELTRTALGASPDGAPLWLIEATCRNAGYLPTYVTEYGRSRGIVRDLHLDLDLGDAMEVIEGRRRERVPHLEGFSRVSSQESSSAFVNGYAEGHLLRRRWVVRGRGAVTLCWWGDRIGRIERVVRCDDV